MEAEQPLLEKRQWEDEEVEDEDLVGLQRSIRQYPKPDDVNPVPDASPVSTNDSKPATDHGGAESEASSVTHGSEPAADYGGIEFEASAEQQEEEVDDRKRDVELRNGNGGDDLEENGGGGGIRNGVYFDKLEDEDVDSIEEIEEEFTELDVEGVLRKQNTHDLYCPKCNSCITRRVILIRRRPTLRRKRKHERKFDDYPTYAPDAQGPENVSLKTGATPAPDEQGNDGEREAFRCLSCLSFFIPTGNGFKIFKFSEESKENENMPSPEKIRAGRTNWFFSIFSPGKSKTAFEQAPSPSEVGAIDQYVPSQSPDNMSASHKNDPLGAPIDSRTAAHPGKPADPPLAPIAMEPKVDVKTLNVTVSDQNDSTKTESFVDGGQVNDGISGPQKSVKDITQSSTEVSLPVDLGGKSDDAMVEKNAVHTSSTKVAVLPTLSFSQGGHLDDIATQSHDSGISTSISSMKGSPPTKEVKTDSVETGDALIETSRGDDVRVVVEAEPVATTGIESTAVSTETGVSESRGLDILKSIVYGGLVESITSLGVVSSAAGAGASTLNVLAMGLANLVGGLLVLVHNLRELKKEQSGGVSSETGKQEDRYQELLGRRDDFPLHATVSILSYLIFGLIPPVVYSFSFRQSDNRDLKLASLAAASLVCIILLAIGKAHVGKPPRTYFKTVLYFVIIGFMASGVSYVVGELLKKLLEELGWFNSSSAVKTRFPEAKPFERAWASY